MAVTFANRTISGVVKSCFVVDDDLAGTVKLVLREDLLNVDVKFLETVDATTIEGNLSPTFEEKLAATTLSNGQNAATFFASRIFVESDLAARYAERAIKSDVVGAIAAIQEDVADLDGRVSDIENA